MAQRSKFKSKKFSGTEDDYQPKVTKKAAKEAAKKTAPKAEKPAAPVGYTKPEADKKLAPKTNGHPAPSLVIASELQAAFDHFNRHLFNGALPPVVFKFVKLKKHAGHFHAGQWCSEKGLFNTHEIALDPVMCAKHGDAWAASVLVHEMVHELEQEEGRGPKKGYHKQSWADEMHKVGLTPVAVNKDGEPTGKETGPSATHKIVAGGKFQVAYDELAKEGWFLTWTCLADVKRPKKEGEGDEETKEGKRQKFCCPDCETAAWAKFSAKLVCGECETPMEPAAKK